MYLSENVVYSVYMSGRKKNDQGKQFLTIGEVSKELGVHKETLRNWERKGIVTPIRVGPRKDRKYRMADVAKIVDEKNIVNTLDRSSGIRADASITLPKLKTFLWKSADILRGSVDSAEYKKYIFALLFYKRVNDMWFEEYDEVMQRYDDREIAEAEYNHRFQLPADCYWDTLRKKAENIGEELNKIFEKITTANSPKLDRIFPGLDFNDKSKFTDENLQKLINHFSQLKFGNTYINSDLLGDAYEYLIQQFAASAGKKGGEFYTPREVEQAVVRMLKPHGKDSIYDMAAGSGGFLLEAYKYLRGQEGEKIANTLELFGQELNMDTFAIAKINMFLYNLDAADIRQGDTLGDPKFTDEKGGLKTFDICVANPPFSIKEWAFDSFKSDKYGRVTGYDMPPKSKADYAFVLHMIRSMKETGRAGIILPHGVWTRGGSEKRIREQLVKNDLIETLIGLPKNLFYGTSIEATICIFNKRKAKDRKNKVLIVNAEKEFEAGKNQNRLRAEDINHMVSVFDSFKNEERYARVVPTEEIAENEYSLGISRYVDTAEQEEKTDVPTVLKEIGLLEKQRIPLTKKRQDFMKELGYENKRKIT